MYRPSLERHNAPYRGATDRADAVNFDLATVHDLFHVQKIAGGNPAFAGHKQAIQDNLTALYTGDKEMQTNAPTAGTLVKTLKHITVAEDLSTWIPLEDGQATAQPYGWQLDASGNHPAAGLSTIITMQPGDVIRLRLHITETASDQTLIAAGALQFEGQDELDIMPLEAFRDGQYLSVRLRSSEVQDVRLALYIAYETTSGQPVSFEVRDFSVCLIQETQVFVKGIESGLKTEMAVSDQHLALLEGEYQQRIE